MSLIAFTDESRRTRSDRDPALYVLAAALVEHDRAADVEDALRALIRPRQRAHWRNDRPAERRRLLDLARALDIRGVVVCADVEGRRREERARGRCMEALVDLLTERRVRELVVESRGERRDAQDRRRLAGLFRGRYVTGVRYHFARPTEAPALWVADAYAGAVGAALADQEGDYLKQTAGRVTVVELG